PYCQHVGYPTRGFQGIGTARTVRARTGQATPMCTRPPAPFLFVSRSCFFSTSSILVRRRWLLHHDREASRAKGERLATSRVIGSTGHEARFAKQLTQFAVGVHANRGRLRFRL